jgi:putative ABC transport system ATP-binding protein
MTSSVKEKSVAMALLQAADLSLKKGSANILTSISFSLNAGEIFALTGRSGSGKSSLLKLLCRMDEPSGGEIRLEGEPIVSLDPRQLRRRIQWVFQTPLMVGKTVSEDMWLGSRFGKDNPEADSIAAEKWMEKIHLSPALLQEDPKRLSVGEAQRVALVRSILLKPQVLLLDEPTSALDEISKQAIEETLREATREGTAIVLVTHDPRQMSEMAAHGLELAGGKIHRQW